VLFGFYVIVGIGLLKLYQWARVVTIAIAFLDFGLYGTFLYFIVYGKFRLIPFFTDLVGSLLCFYIVAYLSSSTVRLVFVRPMRGIGLRRDDVNI
jgi:hypothetical protein